MIIADRKMSRESINENVKRKIIAESMGKCMNPECQVDLFSQDGDIIEKAHIIPYCDTADNSYENLIILCPNCHTKFDKNNTFSSEEVILWKKIRQDELEKFFGRKYSSFLELKNEIQPLLIENKSIYENYYLEGERELWKKFEPILLVNNRKIKKMLVKNLALIQSSTNDEYSNQKFVQQLLLHIDEFEKTRGDDERRRHVLFPKEIESVFGVSPVNDSIIPMTESLEELIRKLIEKKQFCEISLGIEKPYIILCENDKKEKVYLNDSPRLRQLYFDYDCFRKYKVRLDSLNFALKYIKSKHLSFEFIREDNLREIQIANKHLMFVYEYCLSKVGLMNMLPEEKTVIVNLHNWNGRGCISKEAYECSKQLNVELLTMEDFYAFIIKLRNIKIC